jgi:membrane protein DedA with SNARE-associated domain
MEHFVDYVTHLDSGYILVAVFVIAYIENLFPPFPSDVIVVFAGSLIGLGEQSAVPTLALATAGSTLGFISMYWIGDKFGDKVLETGRIRFISVDMVHKVEQWFRKYGYWVIIANRFLAGTRAVVSFFAGISEMKLVPTAVLSAASALVWYSILVYAGVTLGTNWREIGHILSTYSTVVSIVLVGGVLIWLLFKYVIFRKTPDSSSP